MATEQRQVDAPLEAPRRAIGAHPRAFGVLLGLVAWYILAIIFPRQLLPYPYETLTLTYDLIVNEGVLADIWATLTRMFVGYVGSVTLAIIVGSIMGTSRYGMKFFNPYVLAGISVPAIAWAAIMTVIFGYSILSPVSATILTVTPFITINIWKGVENIRVDLIEMAKAFDVSRRRILTRVVLRDIAPELFTANRFGIAMSWKIVTIAEIFAASAGMGYKLVRAYELWQYETAFAWVFLLMFIILGIEYLIIRPIHHRVFDYRQESEVALL